MTRKGQESREQFLCPKTCHWNILSSGSETSVNKCSRFNPVYLLVTVVEWKIGNGLLQIKIIDSIIGRMSCDLLRLCSIVGKK